MADETVVEADGIRVTKSFDADGFPVPAVRFDIVSTRDDETTLTITDEIPDEFDIDQIGFHPDYGSEHWTATGEGVVRFERTIDEAEDYTTVYGVRMGDDEEPSAFLESPTITVGDDAPPVADIEDVVPPESSDIVRELAGGKRDTIPGLEAEATDETAADTEPANEPLLDALHQDDAEGIDAEPDEPAVPTADDGDSETETGPEGVEDADEQPVAEAATDEATSVPMDEPEPHTDDPTEPAAEQPDETAAEPGAEADIEAEAGGETESEPEAMAQAGGPGVSAADVAAVLAEQIRNDEVTSDDLGVIRDELAPKRSNVQLEHLQSRVSEMEAYADALGAFIDENGHARGLLEDLQSDIRAMETTVEELDAAVQTAESERRELRDTLDVVEDELATIEEVEDRLGRVAGDLDALDERVSGVEETGVQVENLSAEIEDVHDQLEAFEEWRDQLSDVFGGGA